MYLISGTGHCGTGYISKVLTSVGQRCTHEMIFNLDNAIDEAARLMSLRRHNPQWGWVGESSWLAAPFLGYGFLRGITIIHLVREPKAVIDSYLRGWDVITVEYQDWGCSHIKGIENYCEQLDEVVMWYLAYNRMVAKHAHIRHRVEDPVTDLLDSLGIQYNPRDVYSETDFNHHCGYRKSDIDLNAIPKTLRWQLRDMALEYGYRWPTPETETIVDRVVSWFRRKIRRVSDRKIEAHS